MSWTDERVDTLKQLWHQGFTASQIAERLGNISRNAVIGKAHRLGLSGRPSPIKAASRDGQPASDSGAESNGDEAGPDGQATVAEATPSSSGNGAAQTESTTESQTASVPQGDTRLSNQERAHTSHGGGRDGTGSYQNGASILDLNDRICKWPLGDPRESDFRFCGGPAVPGLPYCAEHAAQAYQSMPRALEEEEEALRQQAAQRLRL